MADVYRDVDFTLKIMNHTLNTGLQILEGTEAFFKALMAARRGDEAAKMLRKELDANPGSKIVPYFFQNQNKKEVEQAIKDYNEGKPKDQQIKYMVSPANKNLSMLITTDRHQKEVSNLMKNTRAKIIDGGLVPKDMLWTRADGNILKMNGITTNEVVRLSEKAEKEGICITLEKAGKDKYNVLFNEKDAEKMAELSASVTYDLYGRCRAIYEKQTVYNIENELRIRDKVMDTKSKPFFITDADGRTAEILGTKFIYNEPGQEEMKLSRTKHQEEIKMIMSEFRHPVDLTREEYEEYKKGDADKRKRMLIEKDKENGRPQLTNEEAQELKKHEEKRSNVERKLLAGHPLEDYIPNAVTNEEIEMSEYIARNDMNDDFVPEEIMYDQMKERLDEIEVEVEISEITREYNERDLDHYQEDYIDKNEESYLDYLDLTDRNGDHIPDEYQDMNGNGIPDWDEYDIYDDRT